jgi:2-phospho-L-lactate/phosphoenolpyruvate guanylyltransferase
MSLWAIVPVKPFSKGKSRLSELLSPERRTLLNSTLLSRTIRVLKSVSKIHHIIIVSRDSSALSIAHNYGVKTIQEDANIELNKALRRAVAVARAYQVDSILVIPSDLPLLEAGDISEMLSLQKNNPEMIIAPDRRGEGTNGLLLSPPDIINFKFGKDSFRQHINEAKEKNITFSVYENINFGLDIDLPQDLEDLSNLHNTTLLEELMICDLFNLEKSTSLNIKEK